METFIPFSPLLALLQEENSDPSHALSRVRDSLPCPLTSELHDQLASFCRDGPVVYEKEFLLLAHYLQLPNLLANIDSTARRTGNQDHLQAVVDANIGYELTWMETYPPPGTDMPKEECARRGLF